MGQTKDAPRRCKKCGKEIDSGKYCGMCRAEVDERNRKIAKGIGTTALGVVVTVGAVARFLSGDNSAL